MAVENDLRDSWNDEYTRVPATAAVHQDIRARARRQTRRQAAAGLLATAVLGTAAVTGFDALRPPSDSARVPTSLDTAAAEGPVLPTLASLAAHVNALPPEPSPVSGYWYVRLSLTDTSHPGVATGEQWWGPNGEMRQVMAGTEAPADSRRLAPSWASLETLPKDPNKLAAELRTTTYGDALDNPAANSLSNIELYLSRTPAQPSLRAEVIAAIAAVPGIKVDGFAHDTLGRDGLAVSSRVTIHGEAYSERLLISSTSGRLIESESDYGNKVVTTYTPLGVVPNDHATPSGPPPVSATRN